MDSGDEFNDLPDDFSASDTGVYDEIGRLLHQATVAREKSKEVTELARKGAIKALEVARIKRKALTEIERNKLDGIDAILKEAEQPLEEKLEIVDKLVAMIWADLFFIARKVVDNDAGAKDVAQLASSKIFDDIETFDADRSEFRTWYYQVTSNTARDWKKGLSRWDVRLWNFLGSRPQWEDPAEGQSLQLLNAVLDQLSEDCRARINYLSPRGGKLGGLEDISKDFGEKYEASKKRTYKCIEWAKRTFAMLVQEESGNIPQRR